MTIDRSKPSSSMNLAKKLTILVEINEHISRSKTLSEALDATLKILEKRYRTRSAAIMLFDSKGEYLEPASVSGIPAENTNIRYRKNEGLTGQAAVSGRSIIIPQISKEPAYMNKMRAYDPAKEKEHSVFIIPITMDIVTLGVMLIHLSYSSRRDFATTENFLSLVASALLQPISLHRAIEEERSRLSNENLHLKQQLQNEHRFSNIIGNSNEMRDIYTQVDQISHVNTTVLIRGESGTGKELIAQAIHYNSPRREEAFIRVNCAAVPENLIESEFFGYEKGAFTGASARKKGKFELAHGGSIFLDEIGDLSLLTQVKLLRVLQEKEFERIGGTETLKTDVRIIAATNADLEALISEGKFREDLYYRLNIYSIFLPPLRERKSDILLLADHFMMKYGRRHGKMIKRISTPAIDMLMRYHWPGNVRELENCIERAVVVCQDNVIHSYHLPPTLQTAESSGTTPQRSLKIAVETYEKELIQDALKSANGVRSRAARFLDSSERIINYKIEKYNIDAQKFK